MISQTQLHELAKRAPSRDYLLTLYVNVDQSDATNLNRGFEIRIKNAVRACRDTVADEKRHLKFDQDVEVIQQFFVDYEIGERGLFILSDSSRDLFEVHRLDVPVETFAHFGAAPYIRPLVEALDEFERYAVVHCSRETARVFLVELGRGVGSVTTEADRDVHKFDASGRDQMWSQMHFQRKQDLHMQQHMKELAQELEGLADTQPFKRLLLTGPEETVSELRSVLPHELQKLRIGVMPLSPHATEDEIRNTTREWAETCEREEEEELIERVLTAAGKDQGGVTALDDTFNAAVQGRVSRLVYAESLEISDQDRDDLKGRIDLLGAGELPAITGNGCCNDPLEWMIQAVLRQGGDVEQLRGDAAEEFQNRAGGIGALLRY